jgi:hypothetical protein
MFPSKTHHDDVMTPKSDAERIMFPREMKIADYRTYVGAFAGADKDDQLTVTREMIESGNATFAKHYPDRAIAIGVMPDIQTGHHFGCGQVEAREDGVWLVGVQWHTDDQIAFDRVSPVIMTHTAHNYTAICGAVLCRSADASDERGEALVAQMVPTPWSLTPLAGVARDFAKAAEALGEVVRSFEESPPRPVTLADIQALEERVNTHLASMKINAEIAEGLRAGGVLA